MIHVSTVIIIQPWTQMLRQMQQQQKKKKRKKKEDQNMLKLSKEAKVFIDQIKFTDTEYVNDRFQL